MVPMWLLCYCDEGTVVTLLVHDGDRAHWWMHEFLGAAEPYPRARSSKNTGREAASRVWELDANTQELKITWTGSQGGGELSHHRSSDGGY